MRRISRETATSIDPILADMIKPVICDARFEKIINEYDVHGAVRVVIGIKSGNVEYCVSEPPLTIEPDTSFPSTLKTIVALLEAIIAEGLDGLPTSFDELKELTEKYGINYEEVRANYIAMSYYVRKGLSGYGPLYPLILDSNIEEIAVNAPDKPVAIVHRDLPIGWINTNIRLSSSVLDSLVIQLARLAERDVSFAHPYLEALIPGGHRVAATFSREISRHGSSIVIRKHREEPIPLPHLVRTRFLSPLAAAYLWYLLLHKPAILVIGPTASGKTTLLQALLLLIPPYYRVVTIEDTPELNLAHHPHWDSLVTRYAYSSLEGEDIDMYKLSKFALRRRPDYFVIGEIRGEEARVFIHAAGSGHAALSTFHADTVESAIYRLRARPISIDDGFLQLLWNIVVVHRVRLPSGVEARRVVEIVEIKPAASGIEIEKLFTWNSSSDTHSPESLDELLARSYRLKLIAKTRGLSLDSLAAELEELVKLIESCYTCSFSEFLTTYTSTIVRRC
ncbi:type II/IV secretion system ATPase subunit [Hyperthermus butylicus]|uniref:type II/IV secretion system ATPase subunit n=1 Tax=Hyperthermus butylicus TaxID=54248 RepID=UPI00068C7478|nr:type II/IV secretion system ATPase subunit [Hyperthermus butylicus]